ncbi:hypothetical protein C8R45DRAFT_947508 [Mycena sanguinolenta]|nr:hypothetical protein C8R45DRAFT_947508 [Mycena sanguinolenta]
MEPQRMPLTRLSRGRKESLTTGFTTTFVDRDMLMRYLGGGVGHYKVAVPDAEDDQPALPEEEPEVTPDGPEDGEKSDGESDDDIDDDDEEDEDGEPELNDAEVEDGLGPEDGEDGMEDLTDEFGYAAL